MREFFKTTRLNVTGALLLFGQKVLLFGRAGCFGGRGVRYLARQVPPKNPMTRATKRNKLLPAKYSAFGDRGKGTETPMGWNPLFFPGSLVVEAKKKTKTIIYWYGSLDMLNPFSGEIRLWGSSGGKTTRRSKGFCLRWVQHYFPCFGRSVS